MDKRKYEWLWVKRHYSGELPSTISVYKYGRVSFHTVEYRWYVPLVRFCWAPQWRAFVSCASWPISYIVRFCRKAECLLPLKVGGIPPLEP